MKESGGIKRQDSEMTDKTTITVEQLRAVKACSTDDYDELQEAFDMCLLSIPPDEIPDLARLKTKWAMRK